MAYGDISSVLGQVIEVKLDGFGELVMGFEKGLDAIVKLRQVVQKHAMIAQAQAVRNISGVTVSYSGGTFIVNRQTGKLARSIQVFPDPGGSIFSAIVVASAKYAAAIEGGSAQRDLKPLLMGKTVAFRVKGGAAARAEAISNKTAVESARRASTGRVLKSEAISFRKVGPKSRGWIIPARAARPFMQATAEQIEPAFRAEVEETFRSYIENL